MSSLDLKNHLNLPYSIRGIKFKNRVIVAPMSLGSINDDKTFIWVKNFYKQLCQHGVGTITMGGFSPLRSGCFRESDLTFDEVDSKKILYLIELLNSYQVKAICQFLHVGKYSTQRKPQGAVESLAPLGGRRAHAMNPVETQELIQSYVVSATKAQKLGFAGIELNASEGFLLNDFLTSTDNSDEDPRFSLSTRGFRVVDQLIQSIRNATGDKFIISLRLGVDFFDDFESDQKKIYFKQVQQFDTDLIVPVFGKIDDPVSKNNARVPEAYYLQFYNNLRKFVTKPIVVNQKISQFDSLKKIDFQSFEFFSFARPFLADPEIFSKFLSGEKINHCISCNQLCIDRAFRLVADQQGISCLVNPFLNFQFNHEAKKNFRSVAIIGGGLLGLQAAYAFSKVGCQTHLFERSNQLGGIFALLKNIPAKAKFSETAEYYIHKIKRQGVTVSLNCNVSSLDLASFDTIVNASGGVQRELSGGLSTVLSYAEILSQPELIKGNIVIIGGGGIGLEVAEFCYLQNSTILNNAISELFKKDYTNAYKLSSQRVFIIDKKKGLMGHGLQPAVAREKRFVLSQLGAVFIDSAQVTEFRERQVTYFQNGKKSTLNNIDTVINCTGSIQSSLPLDICEDPRLINLNRADNDRQSSFEELQSDLLFQLQRLGILSNGHSQ